MEDAIDFWFEIQIRDAKRFGSAGEAISKSEIINDNKLMKRLGCGNKANGKFRFNHLLQRKLYWVEELEDIEFYVLLLYGYIKSRPRSKNKKLVVRNEKGQFENVICLLPKNESMQHMRDKELIANLNRRKAKLECVVPGTTKRVDVMFKLNSGRLGIEIQNSALEYQRVEEKIRLLDHNFDRWFFIVPKKFVDKYDYLNNEHGEMMDMKEAIKEIKAILKKPK